MFAEFNKKVTKWNHSTEGFEYMKLRDYLAENGEEPITVHGYFVNDLQNGKAVTIIAEDCLINMPSHCVEVFEGFGEEQDEAINNGKLAIGNFKEHTVKRFNQKTIYFDYIDID